MSDKNYKVGICGLGVVGRALSETFSSYFEVVPFDVNNIGKISDLTSCDMTFICIPSPDISTLLWIFENIKCPLIVVKSTLMPGTTRAAVLSTDKKVVVNPDFFNDRSAVEEFKCSSRIILGGDSRHTSIVRNFYEVIFPHATYFEVSFEEAEMIKCVTNCAMAVKIALANEFNNLSNLIGADWNVIQSILNTDTRLGNVGWQVPGPDGFPGFGGKCLPLDLARTVDLFHAWGEKSFMLESAKMVNDIIRPKQVQHQ